MRGIEDEIRQSLVDDTVSDEVKRLYTEQLQLLELHSELLRIHVRTHKTQAHVWWVVSVFTAVVVAVAAVQVVFLLRTHVW